MPEGVRVAADAAGIDTGRLRAAKGERASASVEVLARIQRLAGNRAAAAVATRDEAPDETEVDADPEPDTSDAFAGGAPTPAAEPPTPPEEGATQARGTAGETTSLDDAELPGTLAGGVVADQRTGDEHGSAADEGDPLDTTDGQRIENAVDTEQGEVEGDAAGDVEDAVEGDAAGDATAADAAGFGSDPAAEQDEAGDAERDATEDSGAAEEGELSAPDLELPAPTGPGQEAVHEVLVPIAREAQEGFTATVAAELSGVRAAVHDEQQSFDATVRAQRRRVAGSFGHARTRVQTAIRTAIEAVESAGMDAQGELDDWHEDARPRARETVAKKQDETRDLGVDKGDEAVALARDEADTAGSRIRGYAGEARERGNRRIRRPGGGSGKERRARREAAREVTDDTVSAIRGNLTETLQQLRGLGPEVRPEFVNRGRELADRLGEQLPGILDQVDRTHVTSTSQLATTVANNTAMLSGLGTSTIGQLDTLESSVRRSLRRAARASKQTFAEGGAQTVAATREQHDAVARAGATVVEQVLEATADPQVRREAARRFAEQVGGDLRSSFAATGRLAQAQLAQVVTTLAGAAETVREGLETLGEEGARSAVPLAAGAEGEAERHAGELIAGISELLIDAIGDGEDVLANAEEALDDRIEGFSDGFDEAISALRDELDAQVDEAATNAREPLQTFDSRISEAMDKAQAEVNKGWLRRQLSSINWGFVAGLVVGLLVTIAVIALLGTGIGALILAGALAGALSVAAATLTEDLIAGRDTNWAELGKQMVIGAAVGALGGAVSGGIGAALANRAAISFAGFTASRAAVQTTLDTGASMGIGVGQNVATGQAWDEGLLANAVVTGAMATPHAQRGMSGATTRARGAAVDRGAAFNVTPRERARTSVRESLRGRPAEAGSDMPPRSEAATEAAQPVPGDGDASHPVTESPGTTGTTSRPAGGGDDGAGVPAAERPRDGAGGRGEAARPRGGGDAGDVPPRPGRDDAATPAEARRQRAVDRARDAHARFLEWNGQARRRLRERFRQAHTNRQRHVEQVTERKLARAHERFDRTGDQTRYHQELQDIEQSHHRVSDRQDVWLEEKLQWVDDLTAQREQQAQQRLEERLGRLEEPALGETAGEPASSAGQDAAAPEGAAPEGAAPEGAAPEGLERPLPGPERLWDPPGETHIEDGRPLVPSTIPSAHIKGPPASEEDREEARDAGAAAAADVAVDPAAPPEPANDFDVEAAFEQQLAMCRDERGEPDEAPAEPIGEPIEAADEVEEQDPNSSMAPVQRADDGDDGTPTALPGSDALERWGDGVRRSRAVRATQAGGRRRR